MLLRYFDLRMKIFVITDAQGNDLDSARSVDIASRTTLKTESRYPQLDLEGTVIDFALRRFRNYLVRAPQVFIITDHKPLLPILISYRQGLIRTEKIKLRYQDINYAVQHQQAKPNQSDYLSQKHNRMTYKTFFVSSTRFQSLITSAYHQ